MIIVKNLTKHIFGEPLFEDVSFAVHATDKIGLVGPNGSGKSTILKIIQGEVEADGGTVNVERERIGYLSQELPFLAGETIGGFLPRSGKQKAVLEKVGLAGIPLESRVEHLSGGEKSRLSLAKILLDGATMLILDEPTNHLDLRGLEWLENFIRDFRGGVLVVSHDRRLLDNSVDKILEIDRANNSFAEYTGGYTDYTLAKEKKLLRQEDEYGHQQNEKRRLELWLTLKKQQARVHPNPATGKLIRAMEKRLQREIYDQEIPKPNSEKGITGLELKGEVANPKLILRAKNVSKSLSEKPIIRDVSFEIRGKERVLLAGENGSGKTTLLRLLIGDSQPDRGEVRIGDNVHVGYFAQEHELLDPNKTVIEEYLSTDRANYPKSPRAALGAFLFGGKDVFKKVSSLSLGERVRLIFAKLTVQENELLILDEPTNHLDIQSREVIENALASYEGAILVVSHDRYFLDKIRITQSLILKNGTIT